MISLLNYLFRHPESDRQRINQHMLPATVALRLSGLPVDSSLQAGQATPPSGILPHPRFAYPLGIHRQRLFPAHIQRHRFRQTLSIPDSRGNVVLFRQRVYAVTPTGSVGQATDYAASGDSRHVRHVRIAQNNIDNIFTQHIQERPAIVAVLRADTPIPD